MTFNAEREFKSVRHKVAAEAGSPLHDSINGIGTDLAELLCREFQGRDLRLVAEAVLLASARVGTVFVADPMVRVAANVMSVAATLVEHKAQADTACADEAR